MLGEDRNKTTDKSDNATWKDKFLRLLAKEGGLKRYRDGSQVLQTKEDIPK